MNVLIWGSRHSSASVLERSAIFRHCLQLLLLLLSWFISLLGILLSLLGILLSLLGLVLLLLGGLLAILSSLPCLLGVSSGSLDVVGDEEVVEDGAGLHLPHIDTDGGKLSIRVELVISLILGVGNQLSLPHTLVGRVSNTLGLELTLEVRVIDLRRLPGAVGLIIPVIWLSGLRIGDLGRNVIVALWLLVLWVVDLGLIDPVVWLLLIRVADLLRLKEVPALLEAAGVNLVHVNLHLVGVVWLDDEGVQVREGVALATNLLLLVEVLTLVVEDHVSLLGGRATDVRSEHDVVLGGTLELLRLVGTDLQVGTTAVDILLVLDGELNHEGLALVGELLGLGGNSVELSILGSLHTLGGLLVTEVLARGHLHGTEVFLGLGLDPAGLPVT